MYPELLEWLADFARTLTEFEKRRMNDNPDLVPEISSITLLMHGEPIGQMVCELDFEWSFDPKRGAM